MSGGLLGSAQNLLASLLGLARTRIELLGTELQEELARLAALLLGALAVVGLAVLGAGFAAAAVLLQLPEADRAGAAAAFAVAFLALAAAAGWALRAAVHTRPRVFDASLTELERDAQALKP